MEQDLVITSRLRQRDEGVDRLGCNLGEKLDGNITVVGMQDRDLVTLRRSLFLILRVGSVQISLGDRADIEQRIGRL